MTLDHRIFKFPYANRFPMKEFYFKYFFNWGASRARFVTVTFFTFCKKIRIFTFSTVFDLKCLNIHWFWSSLVFYELGDFRLCITAYSQPHLIFFLQIHHGLHGRNLKVGFGQVLPLDTRPDRGCIRGWEVKFPVERGYMLYSWKKDKIKNVTIWISSPVLKFVRS